MTSHGNERRAVSVVALCLVVGAAIFVADLFLPLGVAGGIPYAALVLLGLRLPRPAGIFMLAGLATALTVAGYFLSPPYGEPWIVAVNRTLAVLAVWAIAVLAYMQKRAWQRLRDDEARFRVVTETAIDGIIVIDTSGIIRMANPACRRLFGYDNDELIGRNVSMLMPGPDRERHDDYIRRYIETGEKRIIGVGREVVAQHRDGRLFPIQLAVGEAWLSGEHIFTGFIHDLTEHKRTQQRVHDLQSELYRVSRLGELGEMAAAIAHELNQPLSAASNYIEAARETLRRGDGAAATEKANGLMVKAAAQSQRASAVIRQVRAMAGGERPERAPENINDVVEEAVSLALIGSQEKGLDVRLDLAPGLPPCLINRTQVQQVVLNLVRNAVDVLQTCERRNLAIHTTPLESGQVEIAVADSGPGLPEAVAERLFKPFVTTKPNGMGIGLSISRSIVDAHEGRMWAEPNVGGGTVFRFTLPSGTSS